MNLLSNKKFQSLIHDQLSTLEKIKAEYPSYCGQHRVDLDAMIDLARLRSNAK